MSPTIIAIAEKLWQLIGARVRGTCLCEEQLMVILEERISADPELASALLTLNWKEAADLTILLWREIAAYRALRS